jgi:flagellar basal-body rod protein FlgF/flagellar basal-body rod protein FlgG
MENPLLVGLSRQVALTRELEAVANNIANVNTTGFKADATVFEEFLMPVARDNQFTSADSRISFVRDRATWHDLSQGPVQRTGNPLDVAIDGNAFLVVQTAAGERYTRNGALQINANGELVTSEGDRVQGETGPIQFQRPPQCHCHPDRRPGLWRSFPYRQSGIEDPTHGQACKGIGALY